MAETRPCKLRIQVDNGPIQEMEDLGFFLMDSPDILIPPQRDYETENFPEYDGVKVYAYTSYEAFDYTCTLLYVGDSYTMNTKVRQLWNMFFSAPTTAQTRPARQVTIYNDYKGVAVVGYASEMPGEETFVQVGEDCWKFELTIYVSDPSKCQWDIDPIPENWTPLMSIPVGYNLRGKEIIFTNTELLMTSESLGEFVMTASDIFTLDAFFEGTNDTRILFQVGETNTPIYDLSLGGWLRASYLVPNNTDYIVSSNELSSLSNITGFWGFENAYVIEVPAT